MKKSVILFGSALMLGGAVFTFVANYNSVPEEILAANIEALTGIEIGGVYYYDCCERTISGGVVHTLQCGAGSYLFYPWNPPSTPYGMKACVVASGTPDGSARVGYCYVN
ncbi:hypothetical protein [uncultured Alistipes sp.]|jgi:hypothetical protein|uniref:hypothetical protein n=1 Tax=uncultured Alistipes sp. TaxID=538949 RepID=UPI0025F4F549|nr:hypothetical protein [uncultured Alistipes sp.]